MIKTSFILVWREKRNLKVHLVESIVLERENVGLVHLYLYIQELEVPLGDKQNVAMFKMS